MALDVEAPPNAAQVQVVQPEAQVPPNAAQVQVVQPEAQVQPTAAQVRVVQPEAQVLPNAARVRVVQPEAQVQPNAAQVQVVRPESQAPDALARCRHQERYREPGVAAPFWPLAPRAGSHRCRDQAGSDEALRLKALLPQNEPGHLEPVWWLTEDEAHWAAVPEVVCSEPVGRRSQPECSLWPEELPVR